MRRGAVTGSQDRDAVGGEPRVARHNREAPSERLGNDHAIEWIAVVHREAGCGQGIRQVNRKQRQPALGKLVPEVRRKGELANRFFLSSSSHGVTMLKNTSSAPTIASTIPSESSERRPDHHKKTLLSSSRRTVTSGRSFLHRRPRTTVRVRHPASTSRDPVPRFALRIGPAHGGVEDDGPQPA